MNYASPLQNEAARYAAQMIHATPGVTFPRHDRTRTPSDSNPAKVRPMDTKEPFGRVLVSVMQRPDISPDARLIYAILTTCARGKNTCHPSRQAIANMTGWQVRKVSYMLAELEEKGVIRRHGDSGKVTTYELLTPAQPCTGDPCTCKHPCTAMHPTPAQPCTQNKSIEEELILDKQSAGAERVAGVEGEGGGNIVDGWTTESMPIYNAFLDWTGIAPAANFRKVIHLLLLPRGHPNGAKLSNNRKPYNGYSVEEIIAGIEAFKMAGHNSPESLVKHVAGLMKPKSTGKPNGSGQTGTGVRTTGQQRLAPTTGRVVATAQDVADDVAESLAALQRLGLDGGTEGKALDVPGG